jgi:hypothetical protein
MTDPMSAPAPRSGSRFMWLLVLLLVVFVAGLLGSPWLKSRVRGLLPDSLQSADTGSAFQASTKASMTALEQRVAALEQRPGAALPPDLAARIAALEAQRSVVAPLPDGTLPPVGADVSDVRISSVETRLGVLDQSVQAQAAQVAALQQSMGQLDGRVGGISATVSRDAAAARGAVAVIGLRRALEDGRPLGAYLGGVSALVPAGDADLVALQRLAGGVPTTTQVQARYRALRPTLQSALSRAGGAWTEQAAATLRSLVTVKGEGSGPPQTPEAGLLLLDERVSTGDLAAAAATLRVLPRPVQDAARGWLSQVQTHLTARAALARIEAKAATPAPMPAPVPVSPTLP